MTIFQEIFQEILWCGAQIAIKKKMRKDEMDILKVHAHYNYLRRIRYFFARISSFWKVSTLSRKKKRASNPSNL